MRFTLVAILTSSIVAIVLFSALKYFELKVDSNIEDYHVHLEPLGPNDAGEFAFLLENRSELPIYYHGESDKSIEYWVEHRGEGDDFWRFYWVKDNAFVPEDAFGRKHYELGAKNSMPIWVVPPTDVEWRIGVNTETAPYDSSYVIQVTSEIISQYSN